MLKASWDTLNESMTNTTNGNGPGSVGNSNQDFENQNTSNSNDNNPSNPGYRPWEAEVASNHAMSTSQVKLTKRLMMVSDVDVSGSNDAPTSLLCCSPSRHGPPSPPPSSHAGMWDFK